jgi:hypothetical protein
LKGKKTKKQIAKVRKKERKKIREPKPPLDPQKKNTQKQDFPCKSKGCFVPLPQMSLDP